MRILFISSSLSVGGAEIFTTELAKRLAEKGNEIGILVFRPIQEMSSLIASEKIRLFTAKRRGKFDFSFLSSIVAQLNDFQPELIISLSSFAYFFAQLAQKFSHQRCRHSIIFHTLRPFSFKEAFFTRISLFFSLFWKPYYLFLCQKQLAMIQKTNFLPRKRSFVIHNGIDTAFFTPAEEKKDGRLNIIHIANMRPEKDQLTLFRALWVLNEGLVEWQLVFIGEDKDDLSDKFKTYLGKWKLSDKIKFVKAAERVVIRSLLQDADVFVLTSVVEVMPISALEALSVGLPCILTDVGGSSEIIKEGYNGFLVKVKDYKQIAEKLSYLHRNREVLRKMKKNARESALKNFDINVCAQEYSTLFGSLIKNR